jgi:glutamyl-tRNA(Gln) amidotransferase subunit E
VVEIKKMEETAPEDYAAMGFRSGLEIHQQLDTAKKLFCRCPVLPYSEEFHAEILRHMRPTLSELGEYDGTALMEFKTKKEIIYQIHQDNVCTYEMDDTPPFELNEEALDIALEITMLLNCNLVSELHIARKQYLDGSIPTGFQRTTILGVDGWIPYRDRRIGIRQLGLEEDACREVSDIGHMRTYRTDRLGIPLAETVTYPDMKTPTEVADVAQIIRWLTRSTGKVKRGIGAARQDVNVSVEGGRRVEIKGVPRIPLIPLLVHTEAFRQLALLEIKRELERRGISHQTFSADISGVTDTIRGTQYYPVAKALQNDLEVRAVVLRNYRSILSRKTQPETTFSKEISDRVRVVACLDRLPNIAHSDIEGETLSSAEWTKIKKHTRTGENDVVVIVWGNRQDVETGANEIAIRAEEALDGVPNETRQALPDGTTGFERILPGPNRMYPDTDLPPLAITEERIERVRAILPETPWHREERYRKLGLSPGMAKRMSVYRDNDLFDRAVEETSFPSTFLASLVLNRLKWMKKKGKLPQFNDVTFIGTLKEVEARKLPLDTILPLLEQTCRERGVDPAEAVTLLELVNPGVSEEEIATHISGMELPPLTKDKLKHYLMGEVMARYRGKIEGKDASAIVDRFIITMGT